jgi:riboflavin biosynthesis pyrimidine reductase
LLGPLEVLFEAAGLPGYRLPPDLERLYGRLGFPRRVVYSNFVSSVDGVVTLGSRPQAGSLISGKYPADRFAMGMLRACADAVIIGAGTLRGSPGHIWTPAHVYPGLTTSFAELRSSLGRAPDPQLVLITATGKLDLAHPAVVKGALVLTTAAGAKALGRRLPAASEVVALGRGKTVDLVRALGELRKRGLNVLLTEGGPHLMGELMRRRLLDEVFLTISPVTAGRGSNERLGMVEGVELMPRTTIANTLLSVRRHGEYLFLRYGIENV